jgi:hypothetical protein
VNSRFTSDSETQESHSAWICRPAVDRADDELLGFEMTVVERPYLLDFAGAYLDTVPQFPDEVWAEWEADKREKFGDRLASSSRSPRDA